MLKNRIIAVLVIKDGLVVQSIGFRRYLPVGSPVVAVEFLTSWGVDEIVFLDIDATPKGREPNYSAIANVVSAGQVPLTVGGGISTLQHIEKALYYGADKVAVNAAFISNPDLVREGAKRFGNQCIVVSMDVFQRKNGYEVLTHSGARQTGCNPVETALRAEQAGAGEILLNSIHRDGMKTGYDIELTESVCKAVHIPVIACGGVGNPGHLLEGIRAGAGAVAAGNFFHFSEHSIITTKNWLILKGAEVRLDTYATYDCFSFDSLGRPSKLEDVALERLRFDYIPEELI